MFVDRVVVQLRAGKGGNGVVAWRREKFIPKGGPCGGNGGDGGSIAIEADHDIYSLEDFRNQTMFKASDGKQGEGGNRQGKRGDTLILKVPLGTLIKDAQTGTLLYDFTQDQERIEICKGGKAGRGNNSFKSSRNRTPIKATPGKPGEEKEIELELKLIADVGLVGFPNAGKSTFLSSVTDVPVKIAPYPFTTLKPNLGYIYSEYQKKILLADIPGIIKGASQNKGLGLEFLRHIERCRLLLFLIDISGSDGRDPCEDFKTLRDELKAYSPNLLQKPYFIVLNKTDVEGAAEHIKAFHTQWAENADRIFAISARTKEGIALLINKIKTASDCT